MYRVTLHTAGNGSRPYTPLPSALRNVSVIQCGTVIIGTHLRTTFENALKIDKENRRHYVRPKSNNSENDCIQLTQSGYSWFYGYDQIALA